MRLVTAALLLTVCAVPALAQGRGGLILYDDVGYGGRQLGVDRDVRDLQGSGFNDRISSIRVQSGTWEACEDADFRGRCITVSRDEPNLVPLGFNDRISSLRQVGGGGGNFGSGNFGGGYGDRNGRNDDRGNRGDRFGGSGRGGLELYADVGYRGDRRMVSDDIRNLTGLGFNDVLSSVRVTSGVWELCDDADFRGRCVTVDRDTPSLVDMHFNDRVSSVRRVR